MKLPPVSLVPSIAVAAIPLIKAFDVINNSNMIDTGILDAPSEAANYHAEAPFFRELQSNCPATCSSELCVCVSQYGGDSFLDSASLEHCSVQLHDVCTAGTIADCVAEEYVFIYSNFMCPYAACLVDGQSYEKCQCDYMVNYCGIMGDTSMQYFCDIATCCSSQTDDEGRRSCLSGELNTVVEEETGEFDTIETGQTVATDTAAEAEPTLPATIPDESSEAIDLTLPWCPGGCVSTLCDCVSKYGYAEPCTLEFHIVCTPSPIPSCVADEHAFYYSNVYCPFVACRISGQSEEKCYAITEAKDPASTGAVGKSSALTMFMSAFVLWVV